VPPSQRHPDALATNGGEICGLELITNDIEQASAWLARKHCVHRVEIEPVPDGFRGFWVSSPANIIHLVTVP